MRLHARTQLFGDVDGEILWQICPGPLNTVRHGGRGAEIRTRDLLLPKQARYQAALRPDIRGETLKKTDARQQKLSGKSSFSLGGQIDLMLEEYSDFVTCDRPGDYKKKGVGMNSYVYAPRREQGGVASLRYAG